MWLRFTIFRHTLLRGRAFSAVISVLVLVVVSVVAVAGGFNYRAVRDYVSITRINENGRPVEYRAGREALLQPGDVVTVFERRF